MSASDSPLFTMSPSRSTASPSQSSMLSPRIVTTANRTLLTYSRSSVIPLRDSTGPESGMHASALLASPLPPPPTGTKGFSTSGEHTARALADSPSFALGLIHEGDGRVQRAGHQGAKDPIPPASIRSATQRPPSVPARSLSFRRRTFSKDISGQWGENRNTPPPQGPLPDPNYASPGQQIRLSSISLIADSNDGGQGAQEGTRGRAIAKGTLTARYLVAASSLTYQ